MNGPWSSEVSSVDPRVSQTQWWQSFYRKNKNTDPQAHGPCCGRGLDMVCHFKGKKERKNDEVLHLRGCFGSEVQACRLQFHKCSLMFHVFSLPEESWTMNTICSESALFFFDFSSLRCGEHGSLGGGLHLPCQQIFDQNLCWEHRAWWGRVVVVSESRVMGFYLTPWDDVKSTHTHTQPPKVSAHPPPSSLPYARGTGPIFGFVWGVGGHDWLSASTPTACPQERRTTDILGLLGKTFGSHSSATRGTTPHHQKIIRVKQKQAFSNI